MAGKKPKTNGSGEGEATAASLLREAGKTLMPVLISAGSLLGFVAFAGGVILWTRFHAIGVPPEQAVDAVPDGELIATGSVLLLLFGFFGALALVSAFLVDRSARLTPGMARFLLVLFAFEGAVAIVLVEGHTFWPTVVDLLLFLPPVAGAAWVTVLGTFSVLKDDLPIRDRERLYPVPNRGFLRPDPEPCEKGRGTEKAGRKSEGARSGSKQKTNWAFAPLAIVVANTLVVVVMLAFDASDTVFLSVLGGFALLLAVVIAVLIWKDRATDRSAREADEAKCKAEESERERQGRSSWWRACLRRTHGRSKGAGQQGRCESAAVQGVEPRMYKPRPRRFALNAGGEFAAATLLGVAVALPAIRLHKTWLVIALVAAAAITVAVRRVAWLANERLMWFGIALFLSVPLFGTVMTMARNLDEPRVQPMAIIRSSDGPSEAVEGLYVTETDDRVYFANVATEGCRGAIKANSGRLLWVPKDEVVAMAIGPAQDVGSAGRSAQEMSFALTPGVETSTGEKVTLRTSEGEASENVVGDKGQTAGNRLETAGPAVRPEFGRGLELEPRVALPGQTVRLTRRDTGEKGFGGPGQERTLRLNGMDLDVSPEDWSRNEIAFKVPENATSGVVTIGCEALAGQPYLTVSRKPEARIAVKAVPGSNRVTFDSRRSNDDGEIVSREWRVSGLVRGDGREQIIRSLPPRTGFYRVRLTVTDDEDETDTTVVRILRLRAPHFEFDQEAPESKRMVTHLLKAFSRDVAKDRREAVKKAKKRGGGWKKYIEPPEAIEIAGHADDVGNSAYNVRLSWRRALGVWRALYRKEADKGVGRAWIKGTRRNPKLTIRGFGETCPLDSGGGRLRKNRRVEILVLDDGARAIFPRKCNSVYVKHATWGDTPP